MTIGTDNQTFHVTGNTSTVPVSISAINLSSSAGADAYMTTNCTNVGTADSYFKWSIGSSISMSMGVQGSTDRFMLCFGSGLAGQQNMSMGPVTGDWNFFSNLANFYYVNEDAPVILQVENQKQEGSTTDAVLSALIAGPYGGAYSKYAATGVGTFTAGMNASANEYAISTGYPGSGDLVQVNTSGNVAATSFTASSASISSPDGVNIQVAGVTFDGTNVLNQYSGEQVFSPELKFDGSTGFDNGPGTGQVVLIGQVYFWSFSITLGVSTGTVGGNAQITNLPPGFTTANVTLSSLSCNITSGNQMVMDASGNLYQQNVNGGITALVQSNFGEGSIIQGQGFFFA